MPVKMQIQGLEKYAAQYNDLPDLVQGGVKVTGPAAAYALVWEFGSIRITKPGPKTTWGSNPAFGDKVILTITAPSGYVRINAPEFVEIIKEELKAVNISKVPLDQWQEVLRDVVSKAEERCSLLISETAPIDSGDLRMSIQPAGPDSAILEEGTPNEFGPTELDLGTMWL